MGIDQQVVAVLGASSRPDRYSNQAVRLLQDRGHRVIPVHPVVAEVEGISVVASLADVADQVDTLTVYVSAHLSTALTAEIMALRPRRVIFNPGAENRALQQALEQEGISVQEACTLVLLHTGQF